MTTPSQTTAARPAADTVDNAAATPEKEQPYAALGLKPDEYAQIREILGRRPTSGELAMYSVMWSEHCSYKSSKIYLRQFGEKVSDEMKKRLMVGMGQNAGVVDIGEGWAVTFKVESHNHPSYIEPFQGAATGVGGIVRDIISMGARPVAVMDQLRFGAIDHPDTARVVHGVVSRHLVLRQLPGPAQHRRRDRASTRSTRATRSSTRSRSACCATKTSSSPTRAAPATRSCCSAPAPAATASAGHPSSRPTRSTDGGPTKRPAVQVGDPFAEKVLIECCLELYRDDLVEAIQDLGAAGISCATSELAANGGSGMRVDLEKVLLRDPSLTPEEILMSESQERMMAIVAPEKLDAFLAVIGKWDVETSVLGEVTGDGRLADLLARRADRRRRPLDGRGRRPGLRAARRLPDLDRRAARRLGDARSSRVGRPRHAARASSPSSSRARTSPTRRGSPTSTTTTSWATPRCRSPTTPA